MLYCNLVAKLLYLCDDQILACLEALLLENFAFVPPEQSRFQIAHTAKERNIVHAQVKQNFSQTDLL